LDNPQTTYKLIKEFETLYNPIIDFGIWSGVRLADEYIEVILIRPTYAKNIVRCDDIYDIKIYCFIFI